MFPPGRPRCGQRTLALHGIRIHMKRLPVELRAALHGGHRPEGRPGAAADRHARGLRRLSRRRGGRRRPPRPALQARGGRRPASARHRGSGQRVLHPAPGGADLQRLLARKSCCEAEAARVGEDDYRPATWICERCDYRHLGRGPAGVLSRLRRRPADCFARVEDDGTASADAPLESPPARDDGFVFAAREAALAEGAASSVDIGGHTYALFRIDGQVRAIRRPVSTRRRTAGGRNDQQGGRHLSLAWLDVRRLHGMQPGAGRQRRRPLPDARGRGSTST